jgi:hypothetical protein
VLEEYPLSGEQGRYEGMTSYWYTWIQEPIWLEDSPWSRQEAIAFFCSNGLLPMIEKEGYRLCISEQELTRLVLKCLYAVYQGKRVVPKDLHKGTSHERDHYFHFMFKVDTQRWLQFWDTWGSLQDFQEQAYAYNVRFQLPELIWSWIDLEHSPAAIFLEEELQEEDWQAEVAKGKEDPYLQDTSRRDYQDRHWF